MIQKLICKLFGHKWRDTSELTGRSGHWLCVRCQSHRWEYLK